MTVDLATRAALADLNAGFAWALDLHDWDRLADILDTDVHYVTGEREFHSAAEVIASFRARDEARTTRHGLGNLLLSAGADGSVSGRGSWHTFARNGAEVPGVPLYMIADFHDTYVRHGTGAWRIASRFIVPVFRDATRAPVVASARTEEQDR